MFEEMDLAAKLQKVTRESRSTAGIDPRSRWRPSAGARALGMEKEIARSKRARGRHDCGAPGPAGTPVADVRPISQMVYALKAEDVRDVMVNGKPVVKRWAGF